MNPYVLGIGFSLLLAIAVLTVPLGTQYRINQAVSEYYTENISHNYPSENATDYKFEIEK